MVVADDDGGIVLFKAWIQSDGSHRCAGRDRGDNAISWALSVRRRVFIPRKAVAMSVAEFDASVMDFAGKLRGFIRRRVRDEATADDVMQETLLKVYRSRETLRDGLRLEAWLYRIARTTIIDYYRKQKPSQELPEAIAAESRDEVDELRQAVLVSMKRFLEELPPEYREVVRLAELEGLPLAKIALRMGLSLTAVKSRARRGRTMLKKKLQDCCRFEFDRQGKVIGWERRRPCEC